MMTLMLEEVAAVLGGESAGPIPPARVRGVSTDSRTCSAGDLFFALRGERFDGHAFVEDAFRRGAAGAVVARAMLADVQRAVAGSSPPIPPGALLAVDDPLAALARLAAWHRRQVSAKVIAVVGSNGKTTTKAMIDHILSERWCGAASPKSFNNAIGVPLTLLSAKASHDYLVVEIGTNAPGEVAALGDLVHPDMVVLTGLAEEHLEGLGDLEGVAREECSVFACLKPGGFAAVNTDVPLVRRYLPAGGAVVATFGWNEGAELRLTAARYDPPWLHFTLNGRFAYRLPMPGRHNAVNAAGAITIARRLGLSHEEIAVRLASFPPPPMRNEIVEFGGLTVVNDAYNANPGSVKAALEVLESVPCRGRRVAVLGEMRELGEQSEALHREIGRLVARSRCDLVYLVGAAGEWIGAGLHGVAGAGLQVETCADVETCAQRLAGALRPGDVVLLKASRAVELERVLEYLGRRPGLSVVR